MTTLWFLFSALLLASGDPAAAAPTAYATEEACQQAGNALATAIRADDTVKQGVWTCTPVNFDALDPRPDPQAAPAPAKHIPGKDEA